VPIQQQKEGIHRRYEQCNDGKKNVKKKDKHNEESYERKRQNQDTKDKYLKKERKVVPKWNTEKK
jgi:superfamily I DNA and/or RNA helicase